MLRLSHTGTLRDKAVCNTATCFYTNKHTHLFTDSRQLHGLLRDARFTHWVQALKHEVDDLLTAEHIPIHTHIWRGVSNIEEVEEKTVFFKNIYIHVD